MDQLWANRAASAEAAVSKRHLKRLWGVPGTQLGVVAWPAAQQQRRFGTWHYWWQAHLLDNLVDAQVRDPKPERLTSIARQIRGHRLRNTGKWTNDYYDDMAWLALALERAGRLTGVDRPKALDKLADQFLNSWVPEDGGGIPWRKQDQFFNAPANGPAGIFLARYLTSQGERLRRAQQMSDWIDETLIDPEPHLDSDGHGAGPGLGAQPADRPGDGQPPDPAPPAAPTPGGPDGGGGPPSRRPASWSPPPPPALHIYLLAPLSEQCHAGGGGRGRSEQRTLHPVTP